MEERGDFCPAASEQFLLQGEKEEVVGGALARCWRWAAHRCHCPFGNAKGWQLVWAGACDTHCVVSCWDGWPQSPGCPGLQWMGGRH